MHVAMVNRMLGFVRGGGEIWDLRMAERLEALGVDVTFVAAAPLRGDPPNSVAGFDTVCVRTPHLIDLAYSLPPGPAGALADLDIFGFARRVGNAIDDVAPDLLHVNTWPHFARVADAFDGPAVIKLNGPPHSLWYDVIDPTTSSYRQLERFDAVVTTGVTTSEVADRTALDPVEVNPGVDTETFAPASGADATTDGEDRVDGDALDLLFVGRFVRTKNLPRLVDAVAGLPDRVPARLALVGDGPRREAIRRHVADARLDDVVTFEGYVANEDLPGYYRESDVVVLSSRRENYPIALLEAMSCGIPVVAPDVGAVDRIVTDGEDGLLYAPGSIEGLRECLVRLHDEPELRSELGERARRRALDSFDWGDRARRLEALYADTLEAR